MPRERKDREKSRERDGDKREGKRRSKKEGKSDHDRERKSRATPTVWMSIQKVFAFKACCSLCVNKAERDTAAQEKSERSERRRKREEERERRHKEREAAKASRASRNPAEDNGSKDRQDPYEDGGESEYDVYTSRSGYTESEYGESEYDDGQSTARSRRSGLDEKQHNSSRGRGGQGGGSAVPQIVNLADLKGQGAPSKFLSNGVDEEQGGFTARSGCESVRSYAVSEGGQSAGGQSVASTSVRKYMGCLSEQKSSKEVKQIVKNFVREMVKGREMGVLRADGTLKPVTCGLSRAIDIFKIKSGDQLRKVQMRSLSRLILGASEELDDLETPLDECCSTLELDSGECISFKFAERKKAEIFTMCMQMLADGQKK